MGTSTGSFAAGQPAAWCVFSLWAVGEDPSRAPQSLWAGISEASSVQTYPLREDLGDPHLPALLGQLLGKLTWHCPIKVPILLCSFVGKGVLRLWREELSLLRITN